MTIPAYATSADYETWSGLAAPLEAERLLLRASELLDGTVTALFAVDEGCLPVETYVAEALRDAACAQVRFWAETGEEHDIDGLAGTAVSIGGVSGKRAPVLAPQALRILRGAMLL